MPSYILRKIDDHLWRQFKDRAQSEARGLRWLILELIKRYIERGLE